MPQGSKVVARRIGDSQADAGGRAGTSPDVKFHPGPTGEWSPGRQVGKDQQRGKGTKQKNSFPRHRIPSLTLYKLCYRKKV